MTEPTQTAIRRGHPGAGKKRTRTTPKGKQEDTAAMREVREMLGEKPRRRDHLI